MKLTGAAQQKERTVEVKDKADFCARQREQIKGKKDHAFPSSMATCPQGDLQKWGA